MNKPKKCDSLVLAAIHDTATEALNTAVSEMYRPRQNMAIPRPACDRMQIDRAMIADISIPYLNTSQFRPDRKGWADEGPYDTNEAGVGVGVPGQLSPDHG
jgi:hypothetical protein